MIVGIHPFHSLSRAFSQSIKAYHCLSLEKRVMAVAAAVLGAIITPYFLCVGGILLFHYSVRWLQTASISCAEDKKSVNLAVTGDIQTNRRTVPKTVALLERLFNGDELEIERWAIFKGFATVSSNRLEQGFVGEGYHQYGIGEYYIGEYHNGRPHGIGTYICSSSLTRSSTFAYHGEFVDGSFHGRGTQVIGNTENWYQGEFKEGKFSGKGVFRNESLKATYVGTFRNGCLHGRIKATFDNDGVYILYLDQNRFITEQVYHQTIRQEEE